VHRLARGEEFWIFTKRSQFCECSKDFVLTKDLSFSRVFFLKGSLGAYLIGAQLKNNTISVKAAVLNKLSL
jgi:hypothetical protein